MTDFSTKIALLPHKKHCNQCCKIMPLFHKQQSVDIIVKGVYRRGTTKALHSLSSASQVLISFFISTPFLLF